ncbi:YopX family protein [Klebsiella pneumoniae]
MIKFRGINRAGELDEVVSIDWMHDEVYFERGTDVATPIDQACLMQFTGQKDFDGKEVYVGDIVEVDYYGEATERHVVVAGTRDYPAFHLKPGIEAVECNDFSYIACEEGVSIIVVGNIHQNPELLA